MTTTQQMDWYDQITPVWERGAEARAAFIARTYSHLLMAIAAFVGIEFALFQSGLAETIATALLNTGLGWILVLGAFIVVGMMASKAAHSSRSKPVQYLALFGFVAAEAIIFVPLLWMATEFFPNQGVIQSAAAATGVGFLALTAVAFLTRKDFSFLRSILMWGGIVAVGLIFASLLFGFSLGTFFAVGMIALAGGAILYDTSNILHHYPEDMHVGAALSLFASVAMMFYYVLYLFISMRE